MIKIAHESPKGVFDEVQKLTDYDYALVHLFEEDEEYLNQFKRARDKGREIILDNSIFELEEYKMHQADKIARGEYGFKLHEVQLDETEIKKICKSLDLKIKKVL